MESEAPVIRGELGGRSGERLSIVDHLDRSAIEVLFARGLDDRGPFEHSVAIDQNLEPGCQPRAVELVREIRMGNGLPKFRSVCTWPG